MSALRRRAIAALLVAFAVACGGGNAGYQNPGKGNPDEHAACVARAAWTKATTSACKLCIQSVSDPPCPCDPRQSACFAEAQARTLEPTCDATVDDCVRACGADCACADGCFGAAPACRAKSGALDGCIVAQCDADCR